MTILHNAKLGVQSQKLGVQLHPLQQRRTATACGQVFGLEVKRLKVSTFIYRQLTYT